LSGLRAAGRPAAVRRATSDHLPTTTAETI
jgi:hypothetical protein